MKKERRLKLPKDRFFEKMEEAGRKFMK